MLYNVIAASKRFESRHNPWPCSCGNDNDSLELARSSYETFREQVYCWASAVRLCWVQLWPCTIDYLEPSSVLRLPTLGTSWRFWHTDKHGPAPSPCYVAWWDYHCVYHGVTDYYRNLACLKIVHFSVLSSRYDNLNDKTMVNSLRCLILVEGIMPVNRHVPFRIV